MLPITNTMMLPIQNITKQMENRLMPVGLDLIVCTLSSRKSLSQTLQPTEKPVATPAGKWPLAISGQCSRGNGIYSVLTINIWWIFFPQSQNKQVYESEISKRNVNSKCYSLYYFIFVFYFCFLQAKLISCSNNILFGSFVL